MLITLIYGSTATEDFKEDDLIELLKNARTHNDELDVTGMLLYKEGNFIQVLEGEEDVVENLYEKIARDPRHHSVITIFKRPIRERQFADWLMGFVNFDDLSLEELEGYSDFLEESIESTVHPENNSHAHKFLQNFKTLVR